MKCTIARWKQLGILIRKIDIIEQLNTLAMKNLIVLKLAISSKNKNHPEVPNITPRNI